jgi:3-mercaptopyruvate sulfurtransferase SseA
MKHISCEELKNKFDRDDKFILVNALDEDRFRAMHIPGSINICNEKDIQKCLTRNDDIIIYCTDEACNRSIRLYQLLEAMGYEKIYRFAGGLREWESAGYELVGEMAA